jgi:uncharacterized protein YjiS (DUF1127 family)
MQNTIARSRGRAAVAKPFHCLAAALAVMLRLIERRRQRLQLSELDDHLLRDVGLTRRDVERECGKPFWR